MTAVVHIVEILLPELVFQEGLLVACASLV
jgi:hypothetical protein